MGSRRLHAMDASFEFLSITWAGPGVVQVALNRPRKRNAMNRKLWKEIGRAFSNLGNLGDECRCILLTGCGSGFSAGIDISDSSFFMSDVSDAARNALAFQSKILEMQACFTALEECPVPVVAAVHGSCIGAGVDLICAADVRLCSQDSVFSVLEVRLGLAADVGTLQRFPKIVGNESLVRELCLTGRNFNAGEAGRMGLVSRVLPTQEILLRVSVEMCIEIAQHSPIAVRGTKKALVYARDHTVSDSLQQISVFNATALQNPDLQAAWTAKATKKEPKFENMLPQARL